MKGVEKMKEELLKLVNELEVLNDTLVGDTNSDDYVSGILVALKCKSSHY